VSDFKVVIKKIKQVEHHPNADRLDIVQVDGYRCIVGRNSYSVGDLVAYIPEAAIIPDWLIEQLGLTGRLAGKQKNRVKAVKLRKVLSQGLIVPTTGSHSNAFPDACLHAIKNENDLLGVKEGDDVTEFLGITKYEPPIPSHMNGEVWNAFGMTLNYDIENIKRFPDVLQEGENVSFTEKIHGCVAPHSLVMLPNGEEVTIEEIINNDNITSVLSYDVKTSSFMSKQITAKFRRLNKEKKRWAKMTLENGRVLLITEDHPIFSNDRNEYCKVKDIQPNEDIKSPI